MRLRTEYQIIQMLRYLRGQLDVHPLTERPVSAEAALDGTWEDVEERLIRIRIFEMRPEAEWTEIARSLGMTQRTLYNKRKKYNLLD